MTILNIEDSVVMIIDVQEKLLNAVFNKASLEKKATIIANTAKILGIPVIVTEQYPKGLGATVESLKEALPENTQYFEKTAFSALENNDVLEALKNSGKKQVVIFGIETHICVSQTTNALIQEGFEVSVIRDACGAHVLTTEIALFEWLKGAKHPKFKEVQMLIK